MARAVLASALLVAAACQSPPPPAIAASTTETPIRSLAVIVRGPESAPVPGAAVCALTIGGQQERCGETGASGAVRLEVRPGTYAVQVTPPNGSRLGPARTYVDSLDKDATTVVSLEARSSISGTVRDETGATVPAAEVCAHPPLLISPTCARTDPKGEYRLELRSDVYKLDVTGPPGGTLIPQWARGRLSSDEADIVDARVKDVEGIDVVLIKGVRLDGVVRGPNGPIEDAQVCLRTLAAPLPWDCERTKKNGSYLALREPGTYYIWVIPPDNVRLVAQWFDHALEGVGSSSFSLERDRSLDITLEGGPQIRGTVRTQDGAPLGGAFVCIDTVFPTGRICRPTAPDGSYAFTTRPETYLVQVVPPKNLDLITEFWLRKRNWTEADTVTLGESDRTLDLTVRSGVRVTGVIRDKRGIPLEAATVNLLDAAGPLAAADTDVTGTYSIVVPPGRYQIEAFAPFRGERGDLLSQAPRDLVVNGLVRYDFVLDDVVQ